VIEGLEIFLSARRCTSKEAMKSLEGKTAFITGASSGIGAACARAFASQGARLILNARRTERLDALTKELKVPTYVSRFDVRKLDEVKSALESLPPDWSSIDILVNNAGLARGMEKFHEGNIQDWEEMLDTNVKGLMYVTRLVLPGMVARGEGHIVNIASLAGIETYPNGALYCASKAAVRVITDGLKKDLLGTQIRVTAISPGMVQTEFSEVRFHGDKGRAALAYKGMTPLQAEDVADAVLFSVTRPSHVNISEIVLMPTDQSGTTMVHHRS
jgi:NADP-dependent 3-hydroxy acid dehydrogenase YdfG